MLNDAAILYPSKVARLDEGPKSSKLSPLVRIYHPFDPLDKYVPAFESGNVDLRKGKLPVLYAKRERTVEIGIGVEKSHELLYPVPLLHLYVHRALYKM